MIEVYSWATPNGHKVHIMLEECGLPYRVHGVDIAKYPNVQRWFAAIGARPAVVRALKVLEQHVKPTPGFSAEERENLFGAKQYARR